jgi:transposase-like protein
MGVYRRQFTKEFKLDAVRRLQRGASVAEVACALQVNAKVLHRWRREFREGGYSAFPGNGNERCSEEFMTELDSKIGQQVRKSDFLGPYLQPSEE